MSVMTKQIPVALFVFNRHQDLQSTLDCLKKSGVRNLWVFADGPRTTEEKELTDQVREIISDIEWVVPKIHYQQNNIGLSESIRNGLDTVFKKHDCVIVIEDDICVAPVFYNYMVKCLERYRDRSDILGVTGLRYPFSRRSLNKAEEDVFLAPRFSSWGWGTWKDKWEQIDFNLSHIEKRLQESPSIDLGIAGSDAATSIELLRNGNLSGCWDVYVLMNMLLNNQSFVWPKYNMVENTGLLEGTHADGEAPNWVLRWEKPAEKSLIAPADLRKSGMIVGDFVDFFNLSQSLSMKGKTMLKRVLKKGVNAIGIDVVRVKKQPKKGSINPADYSTTDAPMEVPCQKESYFLILNKYIKEGDRVLDVGMGLGYGMNLLSIKAKEVYAVDVDKKAVKYCTEHNLDKNPKIKELKIYDGYKLPYKDNY
ncbi:MAG: 50S ribosomal protein L11 methyltransferase, partial [bacterium]